MNGDRKQAGEPKPQELVSLLVPIRAHLKTQPHSFFLFTSSPSLPLTHLIPSPSSPHSHNSCMMPLECATKGAKHLHRTQLHTGRCALSLSIARLKRHKLTGSNGANLSPLLCTRKQGYTHTSPPHTHTLLTQPCFRLRRERNFVVLHRLVLGSLFVVRIGGEKEGEVPR